MTTQQSNLVTVTLSFLLAALLLVGAWCVADHQRVPEPPPPTATPWVLVVTATPLVQPAGPPTTRTATPTWTPVPERILSTPLPTATSLPLVTATPTPTTTPRPATPDRPPIQKG